MLKNYSMQQKSHRLLVLLLVLLVALLIAGYIYIGMQQARLATTSTEMPPTELDGLGDRERILESLRQATESTITDEERTQIIESLDAKASVEVNEEERQAILQGLSAGQ